MPHVISNRDFSKLTEAHAGKPLRRMSIQSLQKRKPTFKREWCPMPWKGCVCCGINTACEAENTVYLIWLFHGRQEHEKLI